MLLVLHVGPAVVMLSFAPRSKQPWLLLRVRIRAQTILERATGSGRKQPGRLRFVIDPVDRILYY